jgi:hypothetical protein
VSTPSSSLTPAQIEAREAALGAQAWTGPQGNADAWQLHQDFWNVDTYSLLANYYLASAFLGGLG